MNDVYMYQAAYLCDECGVKAREEIEKAGGAPADPEDEYSYDSSEYPKGPFSDGGGESDSPEHCDSCHVFLKNSLTGDGYHYVLEILKGAKAAQREYSTVEQEWLDYYGSDTFDNGKSLNSELEPEED